MVSSVSENRNSGSGTIIPQILGAGAGAAIGGKVWGRQISAKDVLNQDKFELTAPKEMSAEEKTAFESLENLYKEAKTGNKEAADKLADGIFGKKGEHLTPEQYLDKQGYAAAPKVKPKKGEKPATPAVTDRITASETKLNEEIKGINDKIKTAETNLEKAAEGKKASIQKTIDALKKDLDVKNEKLTKIKVDTELVEAAKDSKKVLKADFATKQTEILSGKTTTATEKAVDVIKGKMPKKFSYPKMGLGAVAGLVAGIIVAKMMAPSEPQAQA